MYFLNVLLVAVSSFAGMGLAGPVRAGSGVAGSDIAGSGSNLNARFAPPYECGTATDAANTTRPLLTVSYPNVRMCTSFPAPHPAVAFDVDAKCTCVLFRGPKDCQARNVQEPFYTIGGPRKVDLGVRGRTGSVGCWVRE
ncbi:hypothetical protein BDV95DRAFT_608446 [Massariosphaeria phaeospora]|uniref:Uncharacterized protein n=1 Tax=Massariosphaeria phaeospora TaxID=100035 RepID=A0A7C8M9F0_9PLEO|nr:hypothetical protein BDV95DRAFT_608446 [Massariosphaeria phaeospora]